MVAIVFVRGGQSLSRSLKLVFNAFMLTYLLTLLYLWDFAAGATERSCEPQYPKVQFEAREFPFRSSRISNSLLLATMAAPSFSRLANLQFEARELPFRCSWRPLPSPDGSFWLFLMSSGSTSRLANLQFEAREFPFRCSWRPLPSPDGSCIFLAPPGCSCHGHSVTLPEQSCCD